MFVFVAKSNCIIILIQFWSFRELESSQDYWYWYTFGSIMLVICVICDAWKGPNLEIKNVSMYLDPH